MATSVYIFVTVLFYMNRVLARDCDTLTVSEINNCNDCIRCGAHWCYKGTDSKDIHCTYDKDQWCKEEPPRTKLIRQVSVPGKQITPARSVQTVQIEQLSSISLAYNSSLHKNVTWDIVTEQNSIDPETFTLSTNSKCHNESCNTIIKAFPSKDFCSATSNANEFVEVKVSLGSVHEDVMIKYHVPCACACSEETYPRSSWCNYRGNYTCGVCYCDEGWSGEFCERTEKCRSRGDLLQCKSAANELICSGNGECDEKECGICKCYTDKKGSQYFEAENYCADICMSTISCATCLRNPSVGKCKCETTALSFIPYNATLEMETYAQDRPIWIRCNDTIVTDLDACDVEYAAMREHSGEAVVMMIKSCNGIAGAAVAGAVNVNSMPVIIGTLVAVIAAAAAATIAYVMYRNQHSNPPLTDPQYQNINAEFCTGENPLYQSPLSSFKNPTYGKC